MKAILTYHSIDDSGSVISVDPARFRAHVQWLAHGSIPVVSLHELMQLADGAKAIALTFDDGFENFGTAAWPLLREHGLPVTLFVVTDRVGGSSSWSRGSASAVPEMPLLDWVTLAKLAEEGLTLGSHTRTHPDLRSVSAAQLDDEIQGAAHRIGVETGRTPTSFAYPYGSYSAATVHAVRQLHTLACTTELRAINATDDPLLLPRLDVYYFRDAGRLERFGSSGFRRYLWLRARGRRLRQALKSG